MRTFNLIGVTIFWLWAYLVSVIPVTWWVLFQSRVDIYGFFFLNMNKNEYNTNVFRKICYTIFTKIKRTVAILRKKSKLWHSAEIVVGSWKNKLRQKVQFLLQLGININLWLGSFDFKGQMRCVGVLNVCLWIEDNINLYSI